MTSHHAISCQQLMISLAAAAVGEWQTGRIPAAAARQHWVDWLLISMTWKTNFRMPTVDWTWRGGRPPPVSIPSQYYPPLVSRCRLLCNYRNPTVTVHIECWRCFVLESFWKVLEFFPQTGHHVKACRGIICELNRTETPHHLRCVDSTNQTNWLISSVLIWWLHQFACAIVRSV